MWRTVKCNAGSVDMQFKGANTNNAEDSVAIIDYAIARGVRSHLIGTVVRC